MPLLFITGSPGTGKSEACRRLKNRGFEAYDTDSDGLAQWKNLETGYIHPKSSISAGDRTPDFIKTHVWQVPRSKVEELQNRAAKGLVFLCGDIGNEDEVINLFDGIIALHIDEETLMQRLSIRTENEWGWQPHEQQHTLEYHREAYARYRQLGAAIIDSTQPYEAVVNDILSVANALVDTAA